MTYANGYHIINKELGNDVNDDDDDDDDDDVYINKYSNNIKMHGISYNPNKNEYTIVLQDGKCEECGKKYVDVGHKWCESCLMDYLEEISQIGQAAIN
ncbi:unnamed protein product [Rhizophagus irregularis]|nr:unnamed protein product [Rhizophagus irregularis]